jgi:hypothetical protein
MDVSAAVMGTRLCPEAGLLLCCARTRMESATAERIHALIRNGIDWDAFLPITLAHQMSSLVYWNLRHTCQEAVPPEVLDQLRNESRANAFRNSCLTAELLKLLRLFEARGIPAVPFKGLILAASSYGNLALRQLLDLDILVQKRDLLQAKELLTSHGYRPCVPMTDGQQASYIDSHYNYKLVRDDDQVIVELHWRFSRRFHFPVELPRVWQRLETFSLAGATVRNLAREDLLLVLCMHGTKHCWSSLKWICDIAELIRTHPEMEWESVIERARILGSQRSLWLGLHLASGLLGATLPDAVLRRIRADLVVESLVGQVRGRLFAATDRKLTVIEQYLFYFRTAERSSDRARYVPLLLRALWQTSMTPTAGAIKLPPALRLLYYLHGPIRLAQAYGAGPMRRLRMIVASRSTMPPAIDRKGRG